MGRPGITLALSTEERTSLEQMRDHHPRPYLRERAAALLRIADGTPAYQVAIRGILKPRRPNTIYRWLHHYQQHGLAALYQKPRRRRRIPP